jgi:hypothetical protein
MALLQTQLPPRPLRIDLSLRLAVGTTFVAGIFGAALDTVHGAPAKTLFAFFLAAGAAFATATVRRQNLVATVVAVPLTYFVLLLLGGFAAGGDFRYWFVTSFIVKAPVVLIATAAAVVVAFARGAARR